MNPNKITDEQFQKLHERVTKELRVAESFGMDADELRHHFGITLPFWDAWCAWVAKNDVPYTGIEDRRVGGEPTVIYFDRKK